MQGRSFIGIILIALGAGFLLDQLDIISFTTLISIYWPVFIILIGANHTFTKGHSTSWGIVLILVGLFFLLRNLDLFPSDIGKYFWPVLLIVIGVVIIFGRPRHDGLARYKDDILNHFVVFSGLEGKCVSKDFKGGSATVVFGGIDIDLRDANLSEEGAFLDLVAVFGGIDLKVPDNWKVIVKGTPIFGGWENKTRTPDNPGENQPTLNIKCLVMFGGMGVEN